MKAAFTLKRDEAHALDAILQRLAGRAKQPLSLDKLLGAWADLVAQVERGYTFTIYDYTNALCVRDLIQEVITGAPAAAGAKLDRAVKPWDDRFLAATRQVDESLLPRFDGGTASWWWFRLPVKLVGELREDVLNDEALMRAYDAAKSSGDEAIPFEQAIEEIERRR